MRLSALSVAILISGCASAPSSTMEKAGLRVVGEPAPACEPGHQGALTGGALTIVPGQTICLTLQLRGDSVVPVSVVSTVDPQNTLVVRLWQESGTNETFLTLHNPLNKFLSYQASLLRPGTFQRQYTSSCPVLSRRLGVEQWPYPVNEITLSDFAALPDSDKMVCK
jgi:hypothetical protein